MHMVWHDYEIMQLEFSRRHIRSQHVDEQRRVPLRLQQGSAHAHFRRNKKCTRRAEDLARISIAERCCHKQGLKPGSFLCYAARLKSCPDTKLTLLLATFDVVDRTKSSCVKHRDFPFVRFDPDSISDLCGAHSQIMPFFRRVGMRL